MISILFYFHFNTALAIILEHSFYLWARAPSPNIKPLTSAIDVYKSSGKHVTATDAIDKIFGEDLFGKGKSSGDPSKSDKFAQLLAQIALENRLCMSHLASENLICLICTFLAPS
jgi:hypothetical protein